MAALLHAHPFVPTARPAAPTRRPRASRPRLVVLAGGRGGAAPLPIPAVLLGVAVVLALVVSGLRLAQGSPPSTSWQELSAEAAARPTPVPSPGDHVIHVAPGDTLWGIAQRLAPGRDPRPVVAALARANGGTMLRAGQDLIVPAELVGG